MIKQHTFFIKGPSSHQEWTTDPNLIRVTIDEPLFIKAKKAFAFMTEQSVGSCHILYGISFETYFECDDDEKDSVLHAGVRYIQKNPDYNLHIGGLRVFCSGLIEGFVDFEAGGDALTFPLCHVNDPLDIGDKWKKFGVESVINSIHKIDPVLFYDKVWRASDAELEALFTKHKVVVHQQFDGVPIWVIACQITELAKRGDETERSN